MASIHDTNRWVLVTGSAKRIGRAIALELATHGWDIIVHYHRSGEEAQKTAEAVQELGRSACLAEIDFTNLDRTAELISSLGEEIGMIDALVNNASLFEPDAKDPDGCRHWTINADAPRLLSKAFRDHLPRSERGAIVNILDANPSHADFSGYNRSKLFLAEMTRNMAKSFAPQVRVNGVAPGYTLASPRQTEEAFLKMAEGQVGSVSEVARAVRQLLETPTLTGEIVTLRKNAQNTSLEQLTAVSSTN